MGAFVELLCVCRMLGRSCALLAKCSLWLPKSQIGVCSPECSHVGPPVGLRVRICESRRDSATLLRLSVACVTLNGCGGGWGDIWLSEQTNCV